MPDEEIADPERLLQMLQLVHDLGAIDIERRHGLVEHNQPVFVAKARAIAIR
jgi:hypothetical protein